MDVSVIHFVNCLKLHQKTENKFVKFVTDTLKC